MCDGVDYHNGFLRCVGHKRRPRIVGDELRIVAGSGIIAAGCSMDNCLTADGGAGEKKPVLIIRLGEWRKDSGTELKLSVK